MMSQVLSGYIFASEDTYVIGEDNSYEQEIMVEAPDEGAEEDYVNLIEDADEEPGAIEDGTEMASAVETESEIQTEGTAEPETAEVLSAEDVSDNDSEESVGEFITACEDEEQASLRILDSITAEGKPVTAIDFGTIDLSQASGTYSREICYRQGNAGDAPVIAGSPIFTVGGNWFEYPPEYAGVNDAVFGNPFTYGANALSSSSSVRDEIRLNVDKMLAGTYTATYHIYTSPQCVDDNGLLENDPDSGEILIPVRVQLTGINSSLPDRVENLSAEAGNGQIILQWDAIDSFGVCDSTYNIYRRTGSESGNDPDKYDYSLYEQIDVVPALDGITRYIDYSVENGETYSYFVMGSEPGQGYPSIAAAATPTDQAPFRPGAPELAAGPVTGAVELDWNLAEDENVYPGYSEGWADGAGVIDHFNVYRNGVIVAQVDQNACIRRPDEDKYEWIIRIPCEDLSGENLYAGYTWWVTAVATDEMGGLEGYESSHESASPYSAKPQILAYRAEWDPDEPAVTLYAEAEFAMKHLKVWRDGVYLGPSDKYSNGEYRYEDTSAKRGKTYTYRLAFVDGSGVESDSAAVTVKTHDSGWWELESPRVVCPDNWRILNGKTVVIENVDVDADATYRVMKNNEAVAVYGAGGTSADTISYRDTPADPGTYIYRVDKEQDGITMSSMEFAFIKEAQGSIAGQKPCAPELTARICGRPGDRNVQLSWTKSAEGAEPEGYYIYRTDNGTFNTGMFSRSDGHEEYTASHNELSEPAQNRYFRKYAPGNSFVDENVEWTYSTMYPLKYWVCAYNRYGVSEPSQVIVYDPVDANGDGIPEEPENEDTLAPGEPLITDFSVNCNPETYGINDNYYYGYLNVSWEQSPSGGGVDSYNIQFQLAGGGSYSVTRYPGASGEDGQMTAYDIVYFPKDYGVCRVTVEAENSAGTASSEAEYFVGGLPSLSVRPAQTPEGASGASACLEWTAPYKDDVNVTGYEIWRKTADSPWEQVAFDSEDVSFDTASEQYAYTDTGLADGETYLYYVSAITETAAPQRKSVEREVTVFEQYTPPAAPVLKMPVLTGNADYPDLLISWEKPSAGRPTAYYLEFQKTLNGVQGEWEDWIKLNDERRPLPAETDQAGFVTGQMSIQQYNYWDPFSYAEGDSVSFRLQAVNSLGESEWSEPVTISPARLIADYSQEDTKPCPYYAEPVAERGDGQVTLTWNQVLPTDEYAQVLYYKIFRYKVTATHGSTAADWQTIYYNYDAPDTVAQIPAEQDSYTYTDTGLENGQLYAYHAAACSADGHYYNEGITAIQYMKGVVMITPHGQLSDEAEAAQTLVDNLPAAGTVTEDILQDPDALRDLEEQIQESKDALAALPEDEQDQVDQTKLNELESHLEALKQEAGQQGDPNLQTMTLSGAKAYTQRASAGAFSLQVKCSEANAELTYTSGNTKVAKVDAKGRVTPGTAGTATIRVKGTCAGYADAEMTLTVTVTGLAKGGSSVCAAGASRALYKVTGTDTVTYVKCKAAANAKTLSVPATVTINRAVYRVTAVGAGAFTGYKKVKKLTIGANTASIGSQAFKKCKKLKTLTVQTTKLTAGGISKALSGSSIKKVKVPKAVKKAYKKIFKKKVCGRKVSVK